MKLNKNLVTVEDKIRFIVEQQFKPQGVEYLFMNWAQANVALDKVTSPTIVYVLPPSGNLDFNQRRSMVYDAPNAMIAFLAPTDFDFDGQANDDVIENMKRLAIAFIEAVNISGMFENVEGRQQYNVVYDFLDDNVTGITIEPYLKEICGIVMCQQRLEDGKIDLFKALFGHELVAHDGHQTR